MGRFYSRGTPINSDDGSLCLVRLLNKAANPIQLLLGQFIAWGEHQENMIVLSNPVVHWNFPPMSWFQSTRKAVA